MIGYMILGLLIAFGTAGIAVVVAHLWSCPTPRWEWTITIERDGLIWDLAARHDSPGRNEVEMGSALTYRAAQRRAARMACAVENRATYKVGGVS